MGRPVKGSVELRGKNYYYRFSYKGEIFHVKGTPDRAETEALMHAAIAECQQKERAFKPSKNSLITLVNDWYKKEGIHGLRYGTREDYSRAIEKRLSVSDIANMKIATITTGDLQLYFDGLKGKYSASTLKADRSILNATFRYAIARHMLQNNPMRDVSFKSSKSAKKTFLELEAEAQESKKILTPEELQNIIDIIKDSIYYVPFMIGYYTGMREGEVTALSWDCVDLKRKTIKINKSLYYDAEFHRWQLGPPKSGKPRTITIGDSLAEILQNTQNMQAQMKTNYNDVYPNYYYVSHLTDDAAHIYITTTPDNACPIDFVCRKDAGELLTTSTLKYLSKNLQKKYGIYFYFHMLRHTHATMLIENGANMKDVQTRLGHATYQITADTYSHATEQMRNSTAELFEQISC